MNYKKFLDVGMSKIEEVVKEHPYLVSLGVAIPLGLIANKFGLDLAQNSLIGSYLPNSVDYLTMGGVGAVVGAVGIGTAKVTGHDDLIAPIAVGAAVVAGMGMLGVSASHIMNLQEQVNYDQGTIDMLKAAQNIPASLEQLKTPQMQSFVREAAAATEKLNLANATNALDVTVQNSAMAKDAAIGGVGAVLGAIAATPLVMGVELEVESIVDSMKKIRNKAFGSDNNNDNTPKPK